MKKRFAVVGLGGISRFYLKAIKKAAMEIPVLFDIDQQKLKSPKFRKYTKTNSLKELLSYKDIFAVVVTTPNFTHKEIIRACLKEGKHVLCEKPLALSIKDTRELISYAKKQNLLLMTAFHRRYNKNIQDIHPEAYKRIVIKYWENIVEHSSGNSWYLDKDKSGGGCVIDNGINVFDVLINNFKHLKYKKSLLYYGGKKKYEEKAIIEFANKNTTILVDLDWLYKGEVKQIEMETPDGSIKVIDFLRGARAFKGSLWHEYDGVMAEFLGKLKEKPFLKDANSLKAMSFVEDIYRSGKKISGRLGKPSGHRTAA